MTKHPILTGLLIVLILGLIGTSIYFYQRTQYLDRRIETLGHNVIYYCDSISVAQFQINQFKEDSYIRQQEHDTNLIFMLFPAALAIFGLFTFVGVRREFQSYATEIDEKIKKTKRKQKTQDSKLLKQEATALYHSAKLYKQSAAQFIKENNIQYFAYYSLYAADKFAEYQLHDYLNKVDTTSVIISGLKWVNTAITEKLPMTDFQDNDYPNLVHYLKRMDNKEIDDLLSQIRVKLEFPSKTA